MKKIACICMLTAVAASNYAAPFQNLGFDDAILKYSSGQAIPPGGIGLAQNMLPGWQLTIGGNAIGIGYNQIDSFVFPPPNVSLMSQSFPQETVYPPGIKFPIDGQFALVIGENPFNQERFSLWQTGDVPANAKTLTFIQAGSPINVSINGAQIGLAWPSSGLTTTASFDVSQYAGQTITLAFDGFGDPLFRNGGGYFLDNISFAVPEPGTVTLFGLGGGALLVAGLRRRRG